jgi:hypothetical protein
MSDPALESRVPLPADDLFQAIDEYFLSSDKLKKVEAFTRAQRQVEGWFKGELIYLFSDLLGGARLSAWEPEALLSAADKKKCDFVVDVLDSRVFLEVKALYHGKQRAAKFGLDIYLYKDTVGIWGDVLKLSSLSSGFGYNLLFIYPRPEPETWSRQVESYRSRIAPIAFEEVSHIDEFPPELYVCKLRVSNRSPQ